MRLPQDLDSPTFDTVFRVKPDLWRPAVEEICSHHLIKVTSFEAFKNGSNLVALINGETIVKIFPPFHSHQFESEHRVLIRLKNIELGVEIPTLLHFGKRPDGWSYVVCNYLHGDLLEDRWESLTQTQKSTILQEIGSLMKRVHLLELGDLRHVNPRWSPEWNPHVEQMVSACLDRHEELKAPEWLIRDLPALLNAHKEELKGPKLVLLTGEYTPFNLLITPVHANPKLKGMFDFADCMIGRAESDLIGPCMFLGEGNQTLLNSFYRGYGITPPTLEFAEILMAHALTHRYSNFDLQLRISEWKTKVSSLKALTELVFIGK
jgi:hygromycin-B 7''-O-kinase